MSSVSEVPRLSGGQRWALAVAALLALGLAGYGAVGSYETISDLAESKGVPLPGLVPAGVDGGLVGVVTLDLVLAWTAQPVGWLRQLARLLTIGTVAANASAGWPDPVAVGLHSAAPVMLLVMVEAGRAVLLRRVGLASGTARDGIPVGRWVLSPLRTTLLWRRMVLWQIRSYPKAVEAELSLRRARALLRARYGRRWKRAAPFDLVWMLRTGMSADEVGVRVRSLVEGKSENATKPADSAADLASELGVREEKPHAVGRAARLGEGGIDDALFAQVMRINEHHWARSGRPVSAETVRKQLRIGAEQARVLTRAVRAANRAVIDASSDAPIEKGKPFGGANGFSLSAVSGTATSR
jgi:hypothetical protein